MNEGPHTVGNGREMVETEIKHKFLDPNLPRKSGLVASNLESSRKTDSEPPFISLIEFNLSGLCNRTCVFCPRVDPQVFPNINEHIPVELYEKIMGELAEVHYDGIIMYSGFGEPLLYKKIEVLLQMSKRYCPLARIESVTDGDFVTPKKIRSLFDAGLDTLLISMYDGPHQEEHFQAMIDEVGLDEGRVVLRKRWLPPEEHFGITLNNRSGMVEIEGTGVGRLAEPMRRTCYYPFYQVMVDYDGSLLLCPHDWGKKLVVGNLRDRSIHELWRSRIMKRVRTNLARSDRNFAPCDGCDVDGTLIGRPHFEKWNEFYERETAARA